MLPNKYIFKIDKVIEDEKAYLIDVKKQKSLAKDPSYKRKLPLFIAEKDGRKFYVAPISGKGFGMRYGLMFQLMKI